MAITNRERVGKTLDLLRDGLLPYVERNLKSSWGANWETRLDQSAPHPARRDRNGNIHWDNQLLLKTMFHNWRDVFSRSLGHAERSYVSELMDMRNNHAHDEPFSSDDAMRAMDTAERLLKSVSAAKHAEAIGKMRYELNTVVFTEQVRSKVRSRDSELKLGTKSGLKSWREVVTPHKDVASGNFQQAEFAADLAQVHRGEGASEYLDPQEFFARTYLTAGLAKLLEGGMLRLSGKGGDPVVELQTNFGGGKTHSMLALYHLFGERPSGSLAGIEDMQKKLGIDELPTARRAVLVGTAMSPGQPQEKPDGTVTRTLWGEMAWQLGGAEGYAMVAESDEKGASPGSELLAQLLNKYSPCLVLIDEWVAYIRQLYTVDDWPAGTFDANLTFAQALTEAVKAADKTLVVATLPASQIEIGGTGGQHALDRLKHTFSRVEASWRPATPDEGFEIVRRRLFEPITDKDNFSHRDAVLHAYEKLYGAHSGEFPAGCGEKEYRRRMEAAYPIHPELFDRLYNDWGSLDKFQRTRGVLRLMAKVIHSLWMRDDQNLLIMPATVPLDDTSVQSELGRYLEPTWDAVIAHDIDGSSSVPLAIDREIPTLGRYSATRRVARTIYMGAAPTFDSNNPGIDERSIRVGCVQPGEQPASFGDALRRLANAATYLYQDGTRYWYATQPSVARLASDRAAQQDIHDIHAKLIEILKQERNRGDFCGVHVAPDSSADVPDDMEVRLVVFGPEYTHAPKGESRAVKAAEELLGNRGNSPRLYRNMLVFAAPDEKSLPPLIQATRLLMAWSSILSDEEKLNLDVHSKRQAMTKKKELEETVNSRIREAWQWVLAPDQPDAKSPTLEWSASRLKGDGSLASRGSKALVGQEQLFTSFGAERLKMVLDQYLWADKDHLNTKQLWEYFTSYPYLPRLRDSRVLMGAVEKGIGGLVCDLIAYAGRFDVDAGKYVGLKTTGGGVVELDSMSVVIKPEVALAQQDAERAATGGMPPDTGKPDVLNPAVPDGTVPDSDVVRTPSLPKRFFGTVHINPDRAGRDMGVIAEEVLQHLTILQGANVRITVEVQADVPGGIPDDNQRNIAENCNTLKFVSKGFESE